MIDPTDHDFDIAEEHGFCTVPISAQGDRGDEVLGGEWSSPDNPGHVPAGGRAD